MSFGMCSMPLVSPVFVHTQRRLTTNLLLAELHTVLHAICQLHMCALAANNKAQMTTSYVLLRLV